MMAARSGATVRAGLAETTPNVSAAASAAGPGAPVRMSGRVGWSSIAPSTPRASSIASRFPTSRRSMRRCSDELFVPISPP